MTFNRSLAPSASSLTLQPWKRLPSQSWFYNSSSQQLSMMDHCLSTPPVRSYVQVCGRVSTFHGLDSLSAYCLLLEARGKWQLVGRENAVLSQGSVPPPFSPEKVHKLKLAFAGPIITASPTVSKSLAKLTGPFRQATFSWGQAGIPLPSISSQFLQLSKVERENKSRIYSE
jgi:hypothetical protein